MYNSIHEQCMMKFIELGFHLRNVVVQLLSCVWLFVTPWTVALQAFLSFTISQSLLKLMSVQLVTASNSLILYRPFSSCL